MSVWTTKSSVVDRDYIVLKHNLPGINGKIYGVTFRDSYAVVEKNSKTYNQIKRMPVFKISSEYPLTILGKLPFITRSLDILKVYGKEVYTKYLVAVEEERKQAKLSEKTAKLEEDKKRREQLEQLKEAQSQADSDKVQQIIAEAPQVNLCKFTTHAGTLCKFETLEQSPSGYCKMHLLEDPKLPELGFKIPLAMTKEDKKKLKKTIISKLSKTKGN